MMHLLACLDCQGPRVTRSRYFFLTLIVVLVLESSHCPSSGLAAEDAFLILQDAFSYDVSPGRLLCQLDRRTAAVGQMVRIGA